MYMYITYYMYIYILLYTQYMHVFEIVFFKLSQKLGSPVRFPGRISDSDERRHREHHSATWRVRCFWRRRFWRIHIHKKNIHCQFPQILSISVQSWHRFFPVFCSQVLPAHPVPKVREHAASSSPSGRDSGTLLFVTGRHGRKVRHSPGRICTLQIPNFT